MYLYIFTECIKGAPLIKRENRETYIVQILGKSKLGIILVVDESNYWQYWLTNYTHNIISRYM